MRAFIARSRREQIPGSGPAPQLPGIPELTLFLEAFTWVDLRNGITRTASRGCWALPARSRKEQALSKRVLSPIQVLETTKNVVGLEPCDAHSFGLVATLAAWFWPFSPTAPLQSIKPGVDAVRVQVLDPQGRPVEGARVRTSAGNEPQRLPDGWWEIEIPAAEVPKDGRISLWADHRDWDGIGVDVILSDDPNPRFEIRLEGDLDLDPRPGGD